MQLRPKNLTDEEVRSLALFPEENPSPVMRTAGDGILLYANPACTELLREWQSRIGRKLPLYVCEAVARARRTGQQQTLLVECRQRFLYFTLVPIQTRGYVNFYGQDVTEQRRVAETLSENKEDLNRAQVVAHTGSWRLNVQRNELLWSDENHRIFGVAKGTPMDYEGFLAIVHPEDRDFVHTKWTAALQGEPYDIEHRLLVDGQVKWVRERAELEFDDNGRLLGGFGTTQDITSQKEIATRLAKSLREKETLLKEIHHRVKNNLQVVSSLVNLQMDAVEDEHTKGVLRDIRDRFRSMALVHEQLYQSGELTTLDFAAYLRTLMKHLWRGHADASRVHIELDVESVQLPVELAVSCGLIINELAINALTHAFPKSSSGRVKIILRQEPPHSIRLTVQDDGVGFPEDLNWSTTPSMGIRLVRILASQLGGSLDIRGKAGTRCTLKFPINRNTSR